MMKHLSWRGMLATAGLGLCLLFTGPLSAQNVDAAAKSLEVGDYKAAMSELDKALADPSKLKEKALARAYYLRSLARVAYLEKAKDNLEGMQMQQVRDLAVGSSTDLEGAKKNDTDGKMAADLQTLTKRMVSLLNDLGRRSSDIAKDKNSTEAAKTAAFEDLILFSEPVILADKFNYLAYAFKAQGLDGKGDKAGALKNYHLSDDWFFKTAPKNGDMHFPYVHIRMAQLEWELNKNYEAAQKMLDKGKAVLEGEYKKIVLMSNRPPSEKAAFEKLSSDIKIDLERADSDLRLAAGK